MAIINPASAIIAKIKTKYGKRLTEKDYRAMVKCESVGDVVQYMKSYTHYQMFLDKVSNDIHRGNLEQLIRERQFEELLTLCKYNQGVVRRIISLPYRCISHSTRILNWRAYPLFTATRSCLVR